MKTARALVSARRRARLSQRELALRAGMPQSTVGRIEAGRMDPRVGTLERLLRVCGAQIEVLPRIGIGIDRSQIRERLRMSPAERASDVARAADQIRRVRKSRGRAR